MCARPQAPSHYEVSQTEGKGMHVVFGLNNRRYESEYDRKKLALGQIVHVAAIAADNASFADKEFDGSEPYCVTWIAQSEWYVRLSKPEISGHALQKIVASVAGLVTEEEVRAALKASLSDVPLEKLYLSSAHEHSLSNKLLAVSERL